MAYEFTVSDVLPATPMAVYDAWMSNDGPAGMTGAGAEIDAREGGEFSVWDGYWTSCGRGSPSRRTGSGGAAAPGSARLTSRALRAESARARPCGLSSSRPSPDHT